MMIRWPIATRNQVQQWVLETMTRTHLLSYYGMACWQWVVNDQDESNFAAETGAKGQSVSILGVFNLQRAVADVAFLEEKERSEWEWEWRRGERVEKYCHLRLS